MTVNEFSSSVLEEWTLGDVFQKGTKTFMDFSRFSRSNDPKIWVIQEGLFFIFSVLFKKLTYTSTDKFEENKFPIYWKHINSLKYFFIK